MQTKRTKQKGPKPLLSVLPTFLDPSLLDRNAGTSILQQKHKPKKKQRSKTSPPSIMNGFLYCSDTAIAQHKIDITLVFQPIKKASQKESSE